MTVISEDLERRLKNCQSFPTPPPLAIQVIQLAKSPEYDLATVADAVKADPAIAAKVIKIANSSLYARRRQSSNLRQAMIMLGLKATLTLALSLALVSTLRRIEPSGFDFDTYWRRAILAAAWGKLLASEFGRRDAEEIFLSALMQDIGMLVIDKIAPEVYQGIAPFQMGHARVTEHEKTRLATDHRSVGAWLLNRWNLPKQIVRAVQHSHDLSASGIEPEYREYVRAVAMSGDLSDIWLTRRDRPSIERIGREVHRHLGILPNRLSEMFETIKEQMPVAEVIFEMELFDSETLQDITDTAREILAIRHVHALSEVADLQRRASKPEAGHDALKDARNRDALTGSYNRRFFDLALEKEFSAADRHEWPLSVIFVDLDRFKQINDSHGNQAGDAMLCEVADLLMGNLRNTDIVARYGDDEFVLLLPGIDNNVAENVAERLVTEARGRSVEADNGQSVSITVSVGTATRDAKNAFATAKDLLAAADQALYQSKRNGRDQHTCHKAIEAA